MSLSADVKRANGSTSLSTDAKFSVNNSVGYVLVPCAGRQTCWREASRALPLRLHKKGLFGNRTRDTVVRETVCSCDEEKLLQPVMKALGRFPDGRKKTERKVTVVNIDQK